MNSRMRRFPFGIIIVALAGCGSRPAQLPTAAADELAGRVAGAPRRCVSSQPIVNLRVIDAATIAYDLGSRLYVNRLRSTCPGLNPMSTILFDAQGPQYCRGDHFRTV